MIDLFQIQISGGVGQSGCDPKLVFGITIQHRLALCEISGTSVGL